MSGQLTFSFITLYIYIFPTFLNIIKLDRTRIKETVRFNLQDMFLLGTQTIVS